ncbi:MAG: exo-alpha-sialidase [Bacteroidales bacterium]|nr:exo-alpha-sialidase [Bacteroidales bacterium]
MKKLFCQAALFLSLGLAWGKPAPDGGAALVRDALAYRQAPSDSARDAFNARYLHVRPGTSRVDRPHILYPDSTFYGLNRLDENVLPLAFGLVPDSVRSQVVGQVLATVRRRGYRPRLGPEAAPYLLPVLAENGFNAWAYFICDKHPEMVTDTCLSPDAVEAWREKYLAGISVLPGKTVRLRPDFRIQELDSLDYCSETPWGPVRSRFTKDLMHAEWDIDLPKGVRAEVWAPTVRRAQVRRSRLAGAESVAFAPGEAVEVGERGKKGLFAPGRRLRVEDGWSVWRVRGGRYHFSIDFDLPEHVVEEQFVYTHAPFPQCHSATLCFAGNGDLLCAFNGGTAEHEPDTKVRLCRKKAGAREWSAPEAVAGPDKERYCLDNPVLFRIPEPGEPLRLWYKIRPGYNMKEGEIDISTIALWEARLMESFDDGRTWSGPEPLPEGFLGPIKNKPVWHDGRLVCGSSVQSKYAHIPHRIHFEWSDDRGATWHKSAPDSVALSIPCKLRKPGRVGENRDVPDDPDRYYGNWLPISSIQPTILVHRDGSLQALSRTGNGKMSVTWSRDGGTTWSCETLTDIPQNGSGIDAVTLPDGRFALVYNDFETLPGRSGGPRSPLKVAVSEDGLRWTDVVTLEDDAIKEYSYPAVICDEEGYLHIAYTWRRYHIKYVKVQL